MYVSLSLYIYTYIHTCSYTCVNKHAYMYIQFMIQSRSTNGYLFLIGHSYLKLQRCYVLCIIVCIY